MRAALLAFAVLLAACGPHAKAPPANPRLDKLFDQLAQAPNAAEAAPVEAKIWAIWNQSGSPTVDILLERAQAAEAGGDLDRARQFLDQAAEILPAYAEIYDRRAVLAMNANDTASAIEDIERTLEREPRHFGALAALGMIYETMGQERAALEAYRDALAIDPTLEQAKQGVKRLEPHLDGREA
jgi:tetratricopeptide (TPR) repeat protein